VHAVTRSFFVAREDVSGVAPLPKEKFEKVYRVIGIVWQPHAHQQSRSYRHVAQIIMLTSLPWLGTITFDGTNLHLWETVHKEPLVAPVHGKLLHDAESAQYGTDTMPEHDGCKFMALLNMFH